MTVQMHERAIEKIKDVIRELITNPAMREGPPYFNYKSAPFESIASELNKRKNGFDASSLICEFIFLSTYDHYRRENSLSATSEITPENITSLVEMVFDCYNATPFEYESEFPLKQLGTLPNFNDYPFVNIGIDRVSRLGLIEAFDEYSVFKIRDAGCFTGFYPASFMKAIFQKLNVFIFLLEKRKVIKRKSRMHSALSFPAFMEDYIRGEPAHRITVKNISYPYMSTTSNLSLSVSKYLSEIIINSDLPDGRKEQEIIECLNITNSLLQHESKEALRIRAAIDWLVQSDVVDDETISFIQICMGLESVFGDDDNEGSLTTILADRCAYLIGKNIKDRREIKNLFRDIYRIRSKIVHGVRNHLSEKEEYLQHIARAFLSRSILKEIDNLELLLNVAHDE
ncbi:hypothetical protein [Citrobacter freundii]|uniref:hypothetical protein n=1 Tax=Citrobacter freundii TaxID=546 RepID=UPI00333854BB